jgi:uncharacterized protein YbjT (DUF2867 family)
MKVALIGAGGLVGGPTLDALLAAGHDVRALVRRPAAFTRTHFRHTHSA